jgi:hypothetical protein
VCAQVCHHYLAPTLSQLPHDASLLKSPPPPASTGGNPPPAAAAVPSPSFSGAGGQTGATTADAPPEEGAENKENLPELITEVTSNGVVLRDPQFGAFLTPGFRDRDGMKNPDHISESWETIIFWVPGSGME